MKKTRKGNKWILSKIDKNILHKKYIKEGKSAKIVGEEMNIPKPTIVRALHYYDIPINKISYKKGFSKKLLRQKYLKENKSMKDIAKKLNCSISTIHKYIELYNIKVIPKKYIHWTQRPENKEKVKKRNINVRKTWKVIKRDIKRFEKIKDVSLKNLKKANKALCKTTRKYPNRKEQQLNKLLKCLFGSEYKFVGNGKVIINGFNPDFINVNGQKKIIEFYGDYWHNLPNYKIRDKRRLKIYKRYGYKTLIIWERELKNIDLLTNKIKNFN